MENKIFGIFAFFYLFNLVHFIIFKKIKYGIWAIIWHLITLDVALYFIFKQLGG